MNSVTESTFWDKRYGENETAYGIEPNTFFKAYIDKNTPSSLLLPCEGEGRNAIYAAKHGWRVDAFDFSRFVVQKAMNRAKRENVSINYEEKSINNFNADKKYDLIASIYVHMEPAVRKVFHQKVIESLKEGGKFILEAFGKKQINFTSGGPKDVTMLYSIEDLRDDFRSLTIVLLDEMDVELNEGEFHKGKAALVRMIATK